MRTKLQIKNYNSNSIKTLLRKDEKYYIGIRLYACYQVSKGKTSREIQELYNVSFKTVCNWVKRFNKEGIEGLKDKPGRGRKAKLSEDQLQTIKNIILSKTPEDYGYNTTTWTGPIIADIIAKTFNLYYKKSNIYRILNKLGLSYQKGRAYYPEADKEKRREFKNALKKNVKIKIRTP